VDAFLQILLGGLLAGSVYGLIALGFTLIFNVSNVTNLAQGDFFTVGALATLWLTNAAHLPRAAAVVLGIALTCLVAVALERGFIGPAQRRGYSLSLLLFLTAGASLFIQGALLPVFGPDAMALPAFVGQRPLHAAGVSVLPQELWVFGLLVAVAVGMSLFLRRTLLGIAMRATAMNPASAAATGIDAGAIRTLAYAVSGGLGAMVGVFAAPIIYVSYDSGTSLALKGFVAAVLGGLGNPLGALAGGLALGVVESLSKGYVSSLYGDATAFVILILALVVRSYRRRETALGPSFVASTAFSRVRWPGWSRPAAAAIVPVVVGLTLLSGDQFSLTLIGLVGIYGIALLGLDLLRGYAGLLSLGHATFMGVGAYGVALFGTRLGLPPLLGLLAGVAVAALLAVVLGLVCTRLSGYNLALATMGFAVVFQTVAAGWAPVTGGAAGVSGVPPLSVLGVSFGSGVSMVILVWALYLVLFLLIRGVVGRHPGRVLKALHADELATSVLGVDTWRLKVQVFVVSAVLGSLAGGLFASFNSFVSPDQFGLAASLALISMLIVGGEGTLWGALLGALLFVALPELFQSLGAYVGLLQGGLLLAALMLLPGGIGAGLTLLANRLFAPRAQLGRAAEAPTS
jgi:branched-chain amino acid transport system permease protein